MDKDARRSGNATYPTIRPPPPQRVPAGCLTPACSTTHSHTLSTAPTPRHSSPRLPLSRVHHSVVHFALAVVRPDAALCSAHRRLCIGRPSSHSSHPVTLNPHARLPARIYTTACQRADGRDTRTSCTAPATPRSFWAIPRSVHRLCGSAEAGLDTPMGGSGRRPGRWAPCTLISRVPSTERTDQPPGCIVRAWALFSVSGSPDHVKCAWTLDMDDAYAHAALEAQSAAGSPVILPAGCPVQLAEP
ncbi:hypothetical protein HYPSUDRAFT_204640 [Hypholoma sublateritium FD-334 SS-4]|uniref:Uncharacterized protein n=1 Tax=Hypholoma sublateritium (strain FD-334 SS-4) TaxID=945553 RepID=A0A0D2PH51_HYPSF|nr:hypothetical protein HYPSUDRAFT_204640 [Hypholoma sublateritium FD-334 SS-4]